MPDPAPGDAGPPPLESGAPRFAWFDGIVEGRLGNGTAVKDAASRANRTGYGHMDVGFDGGRFSVLMDDATVGAVAMTDENRRVLVASLAEIAAASEGPVESTLRCTEVFQNEVRETVFLADATGLKALTRTRPVADADLHRNPRSEPMAPSMGRGRIAIVLGVLLGVFALVLWSGGWIDRMLAAKSGALVVDTGPFGDLVDVAVKDQWGDYVVTIHRGRLFPVESGSLEALRQEAATPAQRAALEAVVTGGNVWVRLEDATSRGLHAVRAEMRPLVAGAERSVECRLPGRITATRVRLDIEAGREFK